MTLVDDLEVLEADLHRPDHAAAVVELIDAYSRDPNGNGHGLADEVKRELVPGLLAHPGTHVFFAYRAGRVVGIAVCFRGFSTFAARPLLNVHDIAVIPEHRGAGIGRALMARVEACARSLGCCKVTLEVLENNTRARALYTSLGFAPYELDAGRALFWQKKL
jgi:GNAT superfamily N-acetyltransferase